MSGTLKRYNGVSWDTFYIPATVNAADTQVLVDIKAELLALRRKHFSQHETPTLVKAVSDGQYTAVQGGCTDGTYLYYYRMSASGGTTTKWQLIKYNPATDTIVTSKTGTGATPYDHGNGMCYNSNTGKLYVLGAYTETETNIEVVNPSTLEKESEITRLGFGLSSLSYEPSKNLYIGQIINQRSFMILDQNFNPLRTVTLATNAYTKQSTECDANFIYIIYTRSVGDNIIEIRDWDGNSIGTWAFTSLANTSEVEFIARFAENVFYLGTCNAAYNGYNIFRFNVASSGGGGADLPVTSSLLKGNGAGGAVAATSGTDYVAPEAGKSLFSGSYNDLTDKPTIPSPYTLPTATSLALGGIKADPAQSTDTQPVRIDEDGMLVTAPGGSGGSVPSTANLLSGDGSGGISNSGASLAQLESLTANAWNASATYVVGDLRIHNNVLWKCLVSNSGQEPSDGSAYWSATSVGAELVSERLPIKFLVLPSFSTSHSYQLESTTKVLLFLIGAGAMDAMLINVSSSGGVSYVSLNENTVITADVSTRNQITLTNTKGTVTRVTALIFTGSITE